MKKSAFIVLILLAPVLISAFAVSDRTVSQYLTQAQGVMLNGNYKYAIDLYNTVLLMDPNNVDAMIGKGTACKMMGDDARGDLQYENAKKINPDVVLPDLWKYKERDRLRGDKDNAGIAKKYHEMFDKKPGTQDLNISGVPLPTGQVEITGVGVTSAAKNLEQPKAAATTDDDKKKMLADKEWQVRGGNAKMLSLGGIKFVYPDMTTAMDGAGQGIDSGYLFRRKQHVFNLDPYAGYYYRNTGIPLLGLTDQNHTLMLNSDYSLGDVNMPNDYFVSIVKPVFQNSFDLRNSGTLPPQVYSNAGSQFGGSFMLGIKPVPYFGMSGEIGYEYLPYNEVINNGSGYPTMGSTNFMRIEWQAGGGFCLPTVFTQVDQLDLTASFGSYSPLGDPADLENDYLFKLPYSLLQGYTRTVSSQTQGFDALQTDPFVMYQHSDILNSTGYTLKTNLHYMFGNALHEFFAYFETPMNLQYTEQTKVAEKDSTGLVTYSENDSPLTQVASANMFKFKTGLRDDFQYVSIGTKYEIDNSNYYLNTTNVPSIFLPPSNLEDGAMLLVPDFASMITNRMAQYSNAYKITAGINIKPIWAFTIPIEYEYDLTDIRFASQQVGTLYLDKIIRLGLELKPVPIFAVRGGISYETISNQSKAGMPGSAANPFYCITGYHFGAGFDLPIFELNAGGAYKKLFASPTVGATNDNYFVEGFLDINIYM